MKTKPAYFHEIETSLIHTCTADGGTRYVRFTPGSWALWQGESLELLQDADEIRALEAAYTADGLHFQ